MMHQSWPGVRRRRVSHPSIHLPRSVYLPSIKIGASGFSRFSFAAKNSSLATSTAPPNFSAARSTSSVKSICASTLGIKNKDGATCFRLRYVRRAFRIMNKTPGGIITNAVVEYTGDYINLLGPGFMNVNAFPTPARRDVDNLRSRSIRAAPQGSHLNSAAKLFFYRRVLKTCPLDFSHNCSCLVHAVQSSSFSLL